MKQYTHTDADGMKWRFEGSRPISQLADLVMSDYKKSTKKKTSSRKNKSK